jgi:hypothetical protein
MSESLEVKLWFNQNQNFNRNSTFATFKPHKSGDRKWSLVNFFNINKKMPRKSLIENYIWRVSNLLQSTYSSQTINLSFFTTSHGESFSESRSEDEKNIFLRFGAIKFAVFIEKNSREILICHMLPEKWWKNDWMIFLFTLFRLLYARWDFLLVSSKYILFFRCHSLNWTCD